MTPSLLSLVLPVALVLAQFSGVARGSFARTYYIQAERVLWNYTDGTDMNNCRYHPYSEAEALFVLRSNTTIGHSYYRGQYREYTDATFTTPLVRQPWLHLGSLGPVIRGTVGESIQIIFRNALPFACNLRANAEIVTNEAPGSNVAVLPNATRVYTWNLTEASGPGTEGTSSTMWIYRSYIDSSAHDYTGLVGPVIVTRRGAARGSSNPVPTDVDREFVLMFSVMNEGANLFFQDNVDAFLNGVVPNNTEEFEESNLKHAINGFMFCYRDDLLRMNIGERVRWYVMDIGTEVDLHSPHWHGQSVAVENHHSDQFKMEPGTVTVATMFPDDNGSWLLHCHVNDHILAGMVTTYTINGPKQTLDAGPGRTVTYYVAAEEVMWNYMPKNERACLSKQVRTKEEPSVANLSQIFKKALYVCYTDATFRTRCPVPPEQTHLGLLGPVLRANVGDKLRVVFYNKLQFPVSVHPHGVFYNRSGEGASYQDHMNSKSGGVPPGTQFTYRWYVREEAGPGPMDGSTLMWMYHSHTDEVEDTNAGLFGMIIISRYNAVKDYDREFFISVSSIDEGTSLYTEDYLERHNLEERDDEEFAEFMNKLSINGYLHCNQPGLIANVGDRVRWYIMSLGTEIDIHSATWTGQSVAQYSSRKTALILQPASMHSVDMVVAGNCGDFSFYCGVAEHLEHGMASTFTVRGGTRGCTRATQNYNKQVFIQAEEYEWNYASRGEGCSVNNGFTEHELTYTGSGSDRIGSKYIKARFRQYTDATFTKPVSSLAYLGTLGPTLRLAVGDTLRVVFRNNLTFTANIAPLGLQYDSVRPAQPGTTETYFWTATRASGPARRDGSTISWLYRSTYRESEAALAGLAGAIIVSRAGLGGFANEVQREMVLSFSISDENNSPLLKRNLQKYLNITRPAAIKALTQDPDFQESNLKHAVNGNLFCNLRLQANVGERVRLYLLSVGSSLDMHAISIQDNSLLSARTDLYTRTFAADVYAGSTRIVDVVVSRPGIFQVLCDVHDHHDAGMIARIRVQ